MRHVRELGFCSGGTTKTTNQDNDISGKMSRTYISLSILQSSTGRQDFHLRVLKHTFAGGIKPWFGGGGFFISAQGEVGR
jgi:hypothetical protein